MTTPPVDVVVVGSGVAGLICALEFPEDYSVLLVTKKKLKASNSYLAQGGICVLRDEDDREAFIEDTLSPPIQLCNTKLLIILEKDITY